MVEIKTTTKKNINKEPGKETFTIKREWLDKLEREAAQEGMEFKFLKFSSIIIVSVFKSFVFR